LGKKRKHKHNVHKKKKGKEKEKKKKSGWKKKGPRNKRKEKRDETATRTQQKKVFSVPESCNKKGKKEGETHRKSLFPLKGRKKNKYVMGLNLKKKMRRHKTKGSTTGKLNRGKVEQKGDKKIFSNRPKKEKRELWVKASPRDKRKNRPASKLASGATLEEGLGPEKPEKKTWATQKKKKPIRKGKRVNMFA